MEAFIFLVVSLVVLVFIISIVLRIMTYSKINENSKNLNLILDFLSSTKTKPEKPKEVLPEKQEIPLQAKIPEQEGKITEKPLAPVRPPPPPPPPKPAPVHIKPIAPKPVQIHERIIPETQPVKTQSELEKKVFGILKSIWNWIVVGEEYRNKNLSLEYAIATTWLLRVAILFIVIGIGFLLKYSIDNAWLGPIGRVCLSILAGIAMLIGGLKLLKGKYHIIGQGLLGGSIAVFYFSAFASSIMYDLIPVNFAFAVMILITLASGVLAVKLDSMLVAILGTIGGYLTPIMLSTGSENLLALFSYILLLGIGLLGIARYKRWKLLNALSFVFTYLIFFAAIHKIYDKNIHFATTVSFATLYFLLFSGITILYNIINKEKTTILELIGMFANVVIYFLTAYSLITGLYPKEYVAIVSLGLAAFYIAGIFYFIKREIEDKNFLIFLTGFASFFVTITIPLILSDMWLTTAWAIQAFIFLWMSSKLQNKFLRRISYLIYAIAFSRVLFIDLNKSFINIRTVNYSSEMISRFMTFGMLIISVGFGYRLLKNEKTTEEEKPIKNVSDMTIYGEKSPVTTFFIWFASILAFIYLHFEFYYVCNAFYRPLHTPLISLIWVGGILLVLHKLNSTGKNIFKVVLMLLFSGLMIKLFFFDLWSWNFNLWRLTYRGGNSLIRLFDFGFIIAVVSYAYFITAKNKFTAAKLFAVSALGLLFVYTTLELNTFLYNYLPNFRPGGISLLWGLFAISFVFSGIKTNLKVLRYTGLILFAICSLKVFFFDLNQLSSLYRIFAFIALGIFILIGAFIYVKFVESFSTQTGDKIKGEK